MIINLRQNFIFLATLKTASTSIEAALRPRAEICLIESRFGKHMTVAQMMTNLGWLFAEQDIRRFLIFGVVRDPYDFMLSLYNSHNSVHFKESAPRLYTGSMNFTEFLERWVPANASQVLPQYRRFLDASGKIGANYVVSYEKLHEGLDTIMDRLGRERLVGLKSLNESAGKLRRSDLAPEELTWIQNHFREDFAFIARYCNVFLESFTQHPQLDQPG